MTSTIYQKLLGAIVISSLWAPAALAHEFWLEPGTNNPSPGQSISADMKVGQEFLGQSLPYLPNTVRVMTHWSPNGAEALSARIGDLPAMQGIALDQPGLHRLTMETNPAYIEFDDIAEFSDYLSYEGLGAIVQLHKNRLLSEVDIAEAYIRNARALIQVGPADESQRDSGTGMPFEIVALTNPFTKEATSLDVSLTWQNSPVANRQIAIFYLPSGGQVTKDTARKLAMTDSLGNATIEIKSPGRYLLNAVQMDSVQGPGSVVWQSHWASLTFGVGSPQ